MQDYDEIILKLYDILRPLIDENMELKEESDLMADYRLNSMKVIKLLVSVEDTFDISIPLNVLPDIHTVRDFALQLQQLLSEQ